ncbi:MAG: hypothetical protein ACREJX_18610, partial [Polyangiaceae bacterium]
GEQHEAGRLRELVAAAERTATTAKAQAEAPPGNPSQMRAIYEKAGAAMALLEARREQLVEREQKAGVKDAHARDLRRQIEELRAQLSRYAEALEEDLSQGREKVAARTREGLAFEKAFSDVSTLLLNHLKGKPEVRDLLQDLMENMHAPQMPQGQKPASGDSRLPV